MSATAPLGGDDQAWSWSLPFAPSSAPTARTCVTGVLRRVGIAQAVVDDARIVVSELLANALRHARPLPEGCLQVGLELRRGSLRIFVTDGGAATLPTLINPPPMSIGGRGLSIVRTLTRDWGVNESSGGNTVFGVIDST